MLRPGGVAIMSFSNRCFPTKAVAIWTQTGDPDHIWIVRAHPAVPCDPGHACFMRFDAVREAEVTRATAGSWGPCCMPAAALRARRQVGPPQFLRT